MIAYIIGHTQKWGKGYATLSVEQYGKNLAVWQYRSVACGRQILSF